MHTVAESPRTAPARRARPWLMLGIGVAAQASGTLAVTTPALLIPLFHSQLGMSLAQAGLLAAVPTLGMVLTLVAWGAVTDRYGERWVLSGGLVLTAIGAVGAAVASGSLRVGHHPSASTLLTLGSFLLLTGMAAASTNAASGRVVVGWFPAHRRGLAMGIRQTCQPLGVAVAAVTVPTLSATVNTASAFLLGALLTAACAVACALWIVNPPSVSGSLSRREKQPRGGSRNSIPRVSSPATGVSTAAGSPYRGSGVLWRIHLASALLVVPQFALSTFGLVWLVSEQQWMPLAAGILIGISQFVGALGRIGVGILSDRVGSRLLPLKWVTVCAALTMAATALVGAPGAPFIVAGAYLIASCASVADNGLAYTAVAEIAGSEWSGRALGAQNTGQFLAASAVGPALGALIGLVGYPLAFLATAVAPLLALPLVPSPRVEHLTDPKSVPAGETLSRAES
ncbi:MAG: MFS transporter [Lacisediminihabitans sp.]